jgi:opacity protein-like surface antigen
MSRLSNVVLAGAVLAAAPLAAVQAQDVADPYNPSRFAVEGYLSQTWLDTDASDREGLGGFGVRVMFGRATGSQIASTFFNRARTGAFFTYNSEQGDADVKAYHAGVQIDFPLLVAPASSPGPLRFDPFLSLGAGVFNTSVPGVRAGTRESSNDFALTPAAGILIPITGEIKFRGDLRDAIVFGNKTTNNFIAEGGISIGF